jgi:ATP-dependent helicase/nuclease subunit B
MQCAILHLKREHLFRNLGELEDPDLGPSGSIADVRAGLARMQEVLFPEPPEQTGFAEWIWHFLQSIAAAARLDSASRGILNQLEELLQDLQSDFDERTTAIGDYWELLRYLLESTQTYPERGAEERPVSGWLELPWETAPHLVIIGLPEKQVPGPKNLDSFLTPILCRQLGLYGPDELVAFHAFRLRLLLECRRSWGRVDLLLPDRGLDDEPARHSRFLFLARESQILDRVNLLLGERPVEESPLPASFGTRLKLPDPRPLERLSVTAFRSYLQHPFHFLLQNRLYWSAPEPLPRELDAMTFGTLAHEVLERLNASTEGRDLKGPDPIAAFLLRELDLVAARKFGSRLPVPLQIQLESMRERLRAAAREIARAREAGWVPEYAEWAFNADSGTRLEIGGIVISGKIDLIERNSRTGEVRITDYKTSDSGTGAEASHLSQIRSNSGEPPVAACDFERAGKPWRWKDLQLPLYQIAAERFLGTRPSCAYFNLSKAVTEIRIDEWNPEPELSEAALACAEAIIEHIRKGEFPVTAKSRFEDPWLDWFGGDYTATLDTDWLARHGDVEP